MLVEKVWKAARAYGREGYTVVIHGKHEHEETKAPFSNTRRHAPAVDDEGVNIKLQLRRLKKRKLYLKDQIAAFSAELKAMPVSADIFSETFMTCP